MEYIYCVVGALPIGMEYVSVDASRIPECVVKSNAVAHMCIDGYGVNFLCYLFCVNLLVSAFCTYEDQGLDAIPIFSKAK